MRTCVADLEANGLLDEADTLYCGVFYDTESKHTFKFHCRQPDFPNNLLNFMDECKELIMHNGLQFDFPLLKKLCNYEYKGKKTDTLVLSRLFRNSRPLPPTAPKYLWKKQHSVEAWAWRFGLQKPEIEDWSKFTWDMLHRCSEDVVIQTKIYEQLMKEQQEHNWSSAVPMTLKLFEILGEQERYGWLFDKEHADKSLRFLDRWVGKIDKVLLNHLPLICIPEESKVKGEYKHVAKPFTVRGTYVSRVEQWLASVRSDWPDANIRGPFSRIYFRQIDTSKRAEVIPFLLKEGWIPELWNEKDGKRTSPKLSYKDPFNGLSGKVGRLVGRKFQCLHRASVIRGWIDVVGEDGRIHAFVSGIAATGRLTHGGVVNVPNAESFFGKWMRRCFICREGFCIVGTDSAGCQNRMLAGRVGDPFFTETLINGSKEEKTDIHNVNAKAINSLVLERHSIRLGITRGSSKNLNYGTLFGASDGKIGQMVGYGKAVGVTVKEAIFSVAPGFKQLVEGIQKEWRSHAKKRRNRWGGWEFYNGWITGLDGRPIFIDSEHKLLVFLLQSDEAIMMSTAYCMLYRRAHERGWKHGVDWGFLIFMHDEYQCEVREDIAEEFAKVAEQCIVDAGKWYKIQCEHQGDSDIGYNWYETH